MRNKVVFICQKYDKITILKFGGGKNGKEKWICQCECGRKITFTQHYIRRSNRKILQCKKCKPKRSYNSLPINIGDVFGKLKVIEKLGCSKNNGNKYLCRCECGNTRITFAHALYNRTPRKILNCSRFPCRKSPNNTTIGDLTGSYWATVKCHAKKRNIKVILTQKQAWNLFLKQERKCALSKVDIKMETNFKSHDRTASLDRIDSSKDYTIDNVQWVHKEVNRIKNDLPNTKFLYWCKLISKNNIVDVNENIPHAFKGPVKNKNAAKTIKKLL